MKCLIHKCNILFQKTNKSGQLILMVMELTEDETKLFCDSVYAFRIVSVAI